MVTTYKGRNIRPWRVAAIIGAWIFFMGQLFGLPPFGTLPILRRIFLPNASCRYVNPAPTSCFYYQLQDSLANGAGDLFAASILLLSVVILMVLVFGRTWCSWACPFGFVQELFSDAREALTLPSLKLSFPVRAFLRKTKYALIFATLLIVIPLGIASFGLTSCVSTLSLPFCQVCPAKGFFTLLQQIVGLEPWTTKLPWLAIASLGTFIAASSVMKMPFCRICPMGGTMALAAPYSLIYLKKDAEKCTKCRVCLRVCPMDHDKVYEEMGRIDVGGEDCTLCARCVEMCPEDGCLSLSAGPLDVFTSRKPRPVGIINRIKRTKKGKGGSSG